MSGQIWVTFDKGKYQLNGQIMTESIRDSAKKSQVPPKASPDFVVCSSERKQGAGQPPPERPTEPSAESKPNTVPPIDPNDDPIGPGGFITPSAQATPTPSVQAAPAKKDAHVCVPANLVDHYSWDSPPSGGKMKAFRNATKKAVRDESRYVNIDDKTQFIILDKFGSFDPATTDSRDLVAAIEAATSTCPADSYSYMLKVEVNP